MNSTRSHLSTTRSPDHRAVEQHVRTNLTIASSGNFKDAVLELAMAKEMSISEFVRHSLCDMYPKLQRFDRPAEYAVKRNARLRKMQEHQAQGPTKDPDDEYITFE